MNSRKLNVASLMLNLSVLIMTAYSVAHNFRTDIIRETETINDFAVTNFTNFASFRYFTTLSNVFAAIASGIILIFNVKNVISDSYFFPKWIITLKFAATSAVTLTFTTVTLFLSPLIALNGGSFLFLFEGNGFFFHFLLPVLNILSFVFCERTSSPDFKHTFLAALPTIVYATIYAVMVVSLKAWPDFYGFTFKGVYWKTIITVIGLCIGSYGLSVLIYFIRKKYKKRVVANNNLQ